jgi:hypothetical protein
MITIFGTPAKDFRRYCEGISTPVLEESLADARKVWDNRPEDAPRDMFYMVQVISRILSKRYIDDVRKMDFRPMKHLK